MRIGARVLVRTRNPTDDVGRRPAGRMLDSDYITLTEASKLAGLKNSGTLYTAVRAGRLKTVTMATGPRTVRRTTRAWLREYLDSQRHET
jgi:hypothetical protein